MARKIINENPKCPICGCEAIKYGKRNNMQRYRCKNKHTQHVFYDPTIEKQEYQRNSKRILSLLFNMLENNFFDENDLEKALKPTDKFYKSARKVYFNTKYDKNKNIQNFEIECYNPKLLICQDRQSITFIKIPPYDFEKFRNQLKPENYLNVEEDEENNITKREIKIIDNFEKSNLNLKYSCNENLVPYIKDNE